MSGEPFLWAWPFLAAVAVFGGVRVQAARWRRRLNTAVHELRRPLQVLALDPSAMKRDASREIPGPLEQALVALDDLDLAVNGARPVLSRRPVAARPLVEASLERWRGIAARRDRSLSLEWRAGAAVVLVDPPRVMQALDNMFANAIEHGGLRVRVTGSIGPVGLRLCVATAAGMSGAPSADARRGHGLRVVRRVALAHMGRFSLDRGGREVRAVLELPLASAPLPAVPIEWGARAPGQRRQWRSPASRGRDPVGPRAA